MGLEHVFSFLLNSNEASLLNSHRQRLLEFLHFHLVLVRGAGDLATGIIVALKKAGFYVVALETEKPSAIRREVSFSDAVYYGEKIVEGVRAKLTDLDNYVDVSKAGDIPIIVDPKGEAIEKIKPFILVDAIIAKKNLGTNKRMAELTLALGPGFKAGQDDEADVDIVIETMRGHNLGRVIKDGEALANTGVPGLIAGKSSERVIYSPERGTFKGVAKIGDLLQEGEKLAEVLTEEGEVLEILAPFKGVLRGILPDGFKVKKGFKSADIDPRESERMNCFTISDKSRALGNATTVAILEALLSRFGTLSE